MGTFWRPYRNKGRSNAVWRCVMIESSSYNSIGTSVNFPFSSSAQWASPDPILPLPPPFQFNGLSPIFLRELRASSPLPIFSTLHTCRFHLFIRLILTYLRSQLTMPCPEKLYLCPWLRVDTHPPQPHACAMLYASPCVEQIVLGDYYVFFLLNVWLPHEPVWAQKQHLYSHCSTHSPDTGPDTWWKWKCQSLSCVSLWPHGP